jgi:hypothetical protein
VPCSTSIYSDTTPTTQLRRLSTRRTTLDGFRVLNMSDGRLGYFINNRLLGHGTDLLLTRHTGRLLGHDDRHISRPQLKRPTASPADSTSTTEFDSNSDTPSSTTSGPTLTPMPRHAVDLEQGLVSRRHPTMAPGQYPPRHSSSVVIPRWHPDSTLCSRQRHTDYSTRSSIKLSHSFNIFLNII